jgi:micrococcal nuclease
MKKTFTALAIFLSAFIAASCTAKLSEQPTTYEVVKVTDGDTFKVLVGSEVKTVRLIGINTPETVDPRKPVECFGREASARAKELLEGKRVRLEADPSQDNQDKYGRLLRYAYLSDGTNVGKLMIEQGYAYEYTYERPYKYRDEYMLAHIEAASSKRGLWSDGTCKGLTQPVQD